MKYSTKTLFLIDSLGAVASALMLSLVLARFEPVFGMPKDVLFVLAGVAGIFAVYSIMCHLLVTENYKPYLKGIATANAMYSVATFTLVVFYFKSLSWLGIAYFIAEILVILLLVSAEYQRAKQVKRQSDLS